MASVSTGCNLMQLLAARKGDAEPCLQMQAFLLLVADNTVCLFRDHYMMNDKHWLSRLEVRQMAGRAGRSGFDTTGEAILIVGSKYTRQADKISKLIEVRGLSCIYTATCIAQESLMCSSPQLFVMGKVPKGVRHAQDGYDVVSSCLTGAKRGMKRAMLEVVASRAVATAQDVKRYIKCTLLATTTDFEVGTQHICVCTSYLLPRLELHVLRHIFATYLVQE